MKLYKMKMRNLVTFLLTALCFFCQTSNGQDYSSCGLRSVHRGKVLGGLQSRPGMWPWQVAIFRKIRHGSQRPRFICGGALINSRWVLSAAHCFHKRPHEEYIDYSYTVKAGEYKIDLKDPHEQERKAFRLYIHPRFVSSTFENDIALIELDKGVKMGLYVRSICLPRVNENLSAPGEDVSVAGWGLTSKGSHSSILLYSAFEIQSNKKCTDTTRYLFNETVMFCAGHSKGGNDTCKGDSGGSTVRKVLRDGRRRWVTVGLVSWGEQCGIKGKYGYYTRMEPFVSWIQDKINGSTLSCSDPGNIRNGQLIGSEFLVGFTVKYICNEGYQMRGRSKRRCKRNGEWTKAPKCLKVECRDPGTPRYGVRRPRRKKYYYKDKVRFRCKTNYTIVGRFAMKCQSDGTWSGFKPVCLAPCKDPGIPEGGVRLDHSFKHGQTVRFLCRKRNQQPSVTFLICNNGKWNQNIPRCIADCDDPGTPTNGQRRGDDFTLEKRVYFTCDRGYVRVGPAYLQCQSNRRWSDKAPICQHLSCIRPKLPENAYIYSRGQAKERYGFEEVVMFYCNKGYSAYGSPFVKCLADGWTKTNLRCSPKDCGDPGHPTNGRRQGSVFTFDSKVNFTCDRTGFELKGSAQRVCQENGKWSGTRTTCERIECKDLGRLRNGVRRPEKVKYVYEDRIDFRCNTSHTLRGNTFIICQNDKTWTGTVPYCLAPCTDPGIPIGGQRYQHSFLHDSVVQFRCNSGWSREGSHTIKCTDGRWDYNAPTCNKGCSITTNYPTNGGIYGSSRFYNHKTSVRYYCDRGYELVGRQYVKCLNGTWQARQPTCRPVECSDPGRLVNGGRYPNKYKYVFKDSIRFQCKTNFTMRGYGSITCQYDKRWSGNVPTCLAPCRDPGIPANGHRRDHSFLHNARVRFSCQKGWNIDGTQTIRCDDGNWDQPTPQCMEGCQRPKRPDNGGIYSEKDFYKHREQIRYYCSNGYQRLGDEYIACQNGQWKGQMPTCKRNCGDPGRPVRGYFRGSAHFEGKEISFYCYSGYDLIGSRTARCLPTGQWNQPRPVCKRGCYTPQFANSIPNPSLRRGQKRLHGSNITFSCRQQSYTLDGPSVIYCLNGRWNGRVPVCRASCSTPSDLANGQITGQNYKHGQKVTFTCLGLYALVGSSSITCYDGRWALDRLNQWPSCKSPCPNPGIPSRGSRSGSDYRHGRQVFYTCERGTQMIGESSSTCKNGEWSNVRPSCLKICQDPGNIVNGYKTENRRVYLSGNKATYHCNSGYDLAGRAELLCDDDGQWDDKVPVCYGRCKVPSDFTGVQSQPSVNPNESLKHKQRIRFSCPKGKLLVGAKKAACNDGSWSKPFPACQVPCKDLGPIENGIKGSTNFTAKFKCEPGHSLEGPSFIRCVEGKWITSPPQCLKDCEDPRQPVNGMRNSTDFKHGKSVAFQCSKGFRLDGNATITCSNGTWSSTTPRCKGVCLNLDAPQNGKRLGNNFDYGARVHFECNPGYAMDGPSILICNGYGKWSSEPPICRAPCLDPGQPTNGRRKRNNFAHGSAVEFFCDSEYELFGAQTIRCNDGNWSHPIPTCETGCSNLMIPNGITTTGNLDKSRASITFSCISPSILNGKSVLSCNNGRWSDRLPFCSGISHTRRQHQVDVHGKR